jgi:hypothetical protein
MPRLMMELAETLLARTGQIDPGSEKVQIACC